MMETSDCLRRTPRYEPLIEPSNRFRSLYLSRARWQALSSSSGATSLPKMQRRPVSSILLVGIIEAQYEDLLLTGLEAAFRLKHQNLAL